MDEVQSWADEMFGVSPGPTCCQVSRKNFVYLSPQLQTLLRSCKFPDHSTLLGLLQWPSNAPPIPSWPKPQDIDYSQLTPAQIASVSCAEADIYTDPTAQYSAICQQFEHHVSQVRMAKHLPSSLTSTQLGRGQTLTRVFRKPHVSPIKPARPGDVHPTVNSWSLLHCRWLTQCRRVDNYVKHVRKGNTSPTATEHRASLWKSSCTAKGFSGPFPMWWNQLALQDPSMLPWMPVAPPALPVAEHIQQYLTKAFRTFEQQLITRRVAAARTTRSQDINRVFRDVRRPMPVPVTMLVAKSSATVETVEDEGSVIVDNSEPIQQATVLETRCGPMHVIHIEDNQVWFTCPHALQPGDVLAEVRMKGQLHEVHEAFIQEWTRRWDRHRHLPPDHWQEVMDLTSQLLDCLTMELQPISLSRWKQAIRAKKSRSATRLDALSRQDLSAFPLSIFK